MSFLQTFAYPTFPLDGSQVRRRSGFSKGRRNPVAGLEPILNAYVTRKTFLICRVRIPPPSSQSCLYSQARVVVSSIYSIFNRITPLVHWVHRARSSCSPHSPYPTHTPFLRQSSIDTKISATAEHRLIRPTPETSLIAFDYQCHAYLFAPNPTRRPPVSSVTSSPNATGR